jgi:hypothetical protein
MVPILCSVNKNWVVESRKIFLDNRPMPNKIGNHPSLNSVKL